MATKLPFHYDPGFGEKYSSRTKRIINKDGTFNVIRRGTGFSSRDAYMYLLNISWPKFLGLLLLFYLVVNLLFAILYYSIGIGHLQGAQAETAWHSFLNGYFFSVQTFTTVGYGSISPKGISANIVASLEAMTGLLAFALATGLLYGRFSRPTTRILFSRNAIITPPEPTPKLMFRIVNQRSNMLMEVEAKALVMFIDKTNGGHNRQYFGLKLERSTVNFFPMNWTLVHPINEDSPFYGKSATELESLEAEIIILIKAFDDTFSQTVHTRFSYCADEIVWDVKFKRAYDIDENGEIIMDIERLHEYEAVPMMQDVLVSQN